MTDTVAEVGSLEWKMNKAVLNMNNKLKEQGFNERERAFMWGMAVGEMREFLTNVWEQTHHEKNDTHVGEEPKVITDAEIKSISVVAEEPDPSKGIHPIEKPVPKPGPPKK